MDRMRAGLTGLGLVFLSTLAASLVFGPSDDGSAGVEHVKAPGEPLAQLGVAPGVEKDKAAGQERDGQPLVAPEVPQAPADPALADPLALPGAAADRQMGGDGAVGLQPDSRTESGRLVPV